MSAEEEVIRLRAANAALQGQLKDLLRQMASRPHQEQIDPRQPRAGTPSQEALAALQALLAPLFAENGRLVDKVRSQAEHLGTLQERLRYLEAALQAPSATPCAPRPTRMVLCILQSDQAEVGSSGP